MDDLTPFFVIVGLALAACVVGVGVPYLRRRRRARLRRTPMPTEFEGIIERNIPLYHRLPAALQDQLRGHVSVFLGEKRFEGCGGLEMTDEVRVTIAAQACMLMLGRRPNYYPKLTSILVYPEAYVVTQVRQRGNAWVQEIDVRAGESWGHGTVVLTWDHVRHGAADAMDGHNVVFHEFAHQLDQEDGYVDGAPILAKHTSYVTWGRVLGRQLEQLRRDVMRGRQTLLDRYGATDPAEFFAVATETFFEKSRALKRKEPELYDAMKAFYGLDPAEWKEE